MLEAIPLERLPNVELIPQAIINVGVARVLKTRQIRVEIGHDDFDAYEGHGFLLDHAIPFALMHYKGHPKNTTTIYLSMELSGLENITRTVRRILREFRLHESDLYWQRRDDPEL